MLTKDFVIELTDLAFQEVEKIRQDSEVDGFASEEKAKLLLEVAKAWHAGYQGTVPVSLCRFSKEANKRLKMKSLENDPEWKEFLRLKEKFKDVE